MATENKGKTRSSKDAQKEQPVVLKSILGFSRPQAPDGPNDLNFYSQLSKLAGVADVPSQYSVDEIAPTFCASYKNLATDSKCPHDADLVLKLLKEVPLNS